MQAEQLFNHCFQCSRIADKEHYPVGGVGASNHTVPFDSLPYKVYADLEFVYERFKPKVDANEPAVLNNQPLAEWFKNVAPGVDARLIADLQIFTQAFEGMRKLQNNNGSARFEAYRDAENSTVALSESFVKGNAMCVEISLLAKKFLDMKGYESYLLSGEALFKYEKGAENIPQAHTFLVIKHNGQELVFDPSNPHVFANNSVVPKILKPRVPFDQLQDRMKQDCLFVACDDAISKECNYYGVGDCGDVPEKFFVHGQRSQDMAERDDFGPAG